MLPCALQNQIGVGGMGREGVKRPVHDRGPEGNAAAPQRRGVRPTDVARSLEYLRDLLLLEALADGCCVQLLLARHGLEAFGGASP
jgi:hypothetical protein